MDLMTLATQTGPMIAIALYLTWWLTQKLDKKIDMIYQKLDEIKNTILTCMRCNCGGEHGEGKDRRH